MKLGLLASIVGDGLESHTPGEEIEHETYGQLVDLDELLKADKIELLVGYSVKCENGTIRERASFPIRLLDGEYVVDWNTPTYTHTRKSYQSDHARNVRLEENVSSTDKLFKIMGNLMKHAGFTNIRHTFNVPNSDLTYEVDVAYTYTDGKITLSPSVKVDLEVPNLSTPVPPLPVHLDNMVTARYGDRTPDEITFISSVIDSFKSNIKEKGLPL